MNTSAGAPAEVWMDRAVCRTHDDPDLWFPEAGNSPRPAKRLCETCSVAARCLAFALSAGVDLAGVWGGTTETERRLLRRSAS